MRAVQCLAFRILNTSDDPNFITFLDGHSCGLPCSVTRAQLHHFLEKRDAGMMCSVRKSESIK